MYYLRLCVNTLVNRYRYFLLEVITRTLHFKKALQQTMLLHRETSEDECTPSTTAPSRLNAPFNTINYVSIIN